MSPLPTLTLRQQRMLQTRAGCLGLCAAAKGVSRQPLSGAPLPTCSRDIFAYPF